MDDSLSPNYVTLCYFKEIFYGSNIMDGLALFYLNISLYICFIFIYEFIHENSYLLIFINYEKCFFARSFKIVLK